MYQNRNVIELGAGGGLPGIVAALNGANTVCLQNLIMIIAIADPLLGCVDRLPRHRTSRESTT